MRDGWFKSSRSGPNCDNCVEVNGSVKPGVVGIRDSKDRSGPVLMVAPAAFAALVQSAARGELIPA